MSYIEDNLMENEKIKHTTRLHLIVFLSPIKYFVIGVLCLSIESDPDGGSGYLPAIGIILILWSFGSLISTFINYKTSEFGITDKRVMAKTGLIKRHSLEILLSKMESIVVDQSVLGRILGYGNLIYIGTGGTRDKFIRISSPTLFKKIAQEQIANSQM